MARANFITSEVNFCVRVRKRTREREGEEFYYNIIRLNSCAIEITGKANQFPTVRPYLGNIFTVIQYKQMVLAYPDIVDWYRLFTFGELTCYFVNCFWYIFKHQIQIHFIFLQYLMVICIIRREGKKNKNNNRLESCDFGDFSRKIFKIFVFVTVRRESKIAMVNHFKGSMPTKSNHTSNTECTVEYKEGDKG